MNKPLCLYWILISALIGSLAISSIASGQAVTNRLDKQILRTLNVEQYQLHTLPADMEPGAPIRISSSLHACMHRSPEQSPGQSGPWA